MRPFKAYDVLIGNPMLGTIAEQRPLHPQQHQQAHAGPARGQHQRLREHLYGDAQTSRAQREANPELSLPRDRARQQEIRYVGAHDQQYHERNRQQDCQRRAQQFVDPVVLFPGGQDGGAQPRLVFGLAAARLAASAIASPRACAIGTPARRRQIASNMPR